MRKTLGLLAVLILAPANLCAEQLRFGTTFSSKQSAYLGIEWKEAYQATLDLGFDLIRLGAYWDEIETSEGVYQFENLDWQLREAKAKGIPVILTVGMKAPRWPEYFIPPWVLKQLHLRKGSEVSQNAYLQERTLQFIQAVVSRYQAEEAIGYWQLENEPLDRAGPAHWWIGRAFLEQEIELVREIDGRTRPIILTAATHPHRFLRFLTNFFTRHDPIKESLELGDILAVNVYPAIGHQWWLKKSYYWTGAQGRLRYLSRILELAKRHEKPLWIMELQAEPWEPGHLVYLREPHPPTSHPDMLALYLEEIRSLGVDTVLLWGAEYWYYRKTRYGDSAWWDAVRHLLHPLSFERLRCGKMRSSAQQELGVRWVAVSRGGERGGWYAEGVG